MARTNRNQLVFTEPDKCRVCYTCVRECPVKAIKIINGQAQVISERCIGCGNCVTVCSQGAKVYLDSKAEVFSLLDSEEKVIACIAPSFPAEFTEINDHSILVGMLKRLGFDYVVEVSFGADIVAKEYRKELEDENAKPCISSDCPAIVSFIEHYHPDLIPSLSKIASPMVAISRITKKKYGNDVKIVFVGPCIAKKAESEEIDEVITFKELREMFVLSGIDSAKVTPCDFDPPKPGKGAIFPVSRGMLQTINKSDDICEGNIVVAEGRINFRDAIKEFENGHIKTQNLELLCCEGCIMGPGMSVGGKRYSRRTNISNYVREKIRNLDQSQWKKDVEEYSKLDMSRSFEATDIRFKLPLRKEIDKVLVSMGKITTKDHLNCGACGYDTCEEHAIAIVEGLAENEMCLPFTIEKLHKSNNDLNLSNQKLASTRQALKQSEKLAGMGQLSAGIAHELNNPLGVITMYSNILMEETNEDDPLRNDLELIVEQTNRCKNIVGGLLNFARKNQVNLSETNIINFTKQSIKSIIKSNSVKVIFKSNISDPIAMIDTDQMMQVLTNLEKNAIEAMPDGGTLNIELDGNKNEIEFKISDSGVGISKENMEKIFTPFFTTKELGKGTGLGLPLIYGIIKMHKGQISVTSNADPNNGQTGTSFKIVIPREKKLEIQEQPSRVLGTNFLKKTNN